MSSSLLLSNGSSRSPRRFRSPRSRLHSASPRTRGGWTRRQAALFGFVGVRRHDLHACGAAGSPCRRASRRSTVAIVDPGPRSHASGSERPRSGYSASREACRSRDPGTSRGADFAPQPEDATACSVSERSSPEDAPRERGCKSCSINALRSQYQIQNVVGRKRAAGGSTIASPSRPDRIESSGACRHTGHARIHPRGQSSETDALEHPTRRQ